MLLFSTYRTSCFDALYLKKILVKKINIVRKSISEKKSFGGTADNDNKCLVDFLNCMFIGSVQQTE